MTELDVKIALQNYHKFKNFIKVVSDKIEVIETKQTKTGGSIIKIPEVTQSNDQQKLGLIEYKHQLLKDRDMYEYYVSIADHFISTLYDPFKSMVKNKYVDRTNYRDLELTFHYSRQAMDKIIERLIGGYINNT